MAWDRYNSSKFFGGDGCPRWGVGCSVKITMHSKVSFADLFSSSRAQILTPLISRHPVKSIPTYTLPRESRIPLTTEVTSQKQAYFSAEPDVKPSKSTNGFGLTGLY